MNATKEQEPQTVPGSDTPLIIPPYVPEDGELIDEKGQVGPP